MTYNWQQPGWPEFRYQMAAIEGDLLAFSERAGRVSGLLEGLPSGLEMEAVIELMIDEAVRSSAIEGEALPRDQVMSSIRNHLELNHPAVSVRHRLADGAGGLMAAVRTGFADVLGEDTLFAWHRMLLPAAPQPRVGAWRTEGDPMQVVSRRIDEPTVHFEAPPAKRAPAEMERFIRWFNDTAPAGPKPILHAPLRAGIAHLHFESIHPFEDGNGRIGRAISEKALSQSLGRPVVLSLSRTIEAKRNDYYAALKRAQRDNEITGWLQYFARTALQAQIEAEERIRFVVGKTKYLQRHGEAFNERQRKVVGRMLEAGTSGFTGGMNARKYASITGASKATATRDLRDLVGLGAMIPLGSGRSARYELKL